MGKHTASRKRTAVIHFCGKCKKAVGDKEDAVFCEVCKTWHHFKCSDLDQQTFDFLCSTLFESVFWKCEECPAFSNDNTKLVKLIDNQVNQLESMKKELTTTKKMVSENFTKLLSEVEQNQKSVNDQISLSQTYAQVLKTNTTEQEETKKVITSISQDFKHLQTNLETKLDMEKEALQREKKKFNVVFFNVPESNSENIEKQDEDDIKMLKEILAGKISLKQDDLSAIFRIPRAAKNGNIIRPIIMKVTNLEKKSELLRLRDLKFSRGGTSGQVFISPDRTKKQQNDHKQKVFEMKAMNEKEMKNGTGKRFTIRRGEIVPVVQPFRRATQPSWGSL